MVHRNHSTKKKKATIGFDTHEAVKALTKAGFSETQAETVVSTVREAMGSDLATKSDLENGLHTVKSDLKVRMKDLELRLTLRFGGMIIATVGIIIAAMAFFEYLTDVTQP